MTTVCSEVKLPVSQVLRDRLNRRITLLTGLPPIDTQRRALHKQNELPFAAVRELAKQIRQMKRPPTGDRAAQDLAKLDEQISALATDTEMSPDDRDLMLRALQLGRKQATIYVQHAKLTEELLAAAVKAIPAEPLHAIFRGHGIDATDLFGWALYGKALDEFDNVVQQCAESDNEDKARQLAALRQASAYERRICEPVRTEAFWRAYEHAAALLVSGKLDVTQKQYIRCFLRYGHAIHAPWMIDPDISRRCLLDCDRNVIEYDGTTPRLPVLYADEYIDLSAWGYITPTPDEDLELNGRNTEPWKLDRQRRRMIFGQHTLAALQQRRGELIRQIEHMEEENQRTEVEMRQIDRHDPQYHKQRDAAREAIQKNKVAIARLRRALTIMEDRKIPSIEQVVSESQEKLEEMELKALPEQLARAEAKSIRRLCRLCAHLREPFLPAQVAEAEWGGKGYLNDRSTVTDELSEIERRDPTIFKWVLAHSKKMENRVHVRQAPYVLIVPGAGQMALSINPRSGSEVGRLVVPQWNQRRGSLEPILYQAMADFRFDTSRSSGGVDWMHSETLAAAYATVRWNFRKRSKDRRDKAGIDIHQTDRVNFRRHYYTYLESADDGGRKLFFKCQDMYDAFMQFLMLPEGVERCKKT